MYKQKLIFASTPDFKSDLFYLIKVGLSTDPSFYPPPFAYLIYNNQSLLNIRHCVEFWRNNEESIYFE